MERRGCNWASSATQATEGTQEMNSEDFLAIREQLAKLRKQFVESPHGQIPKSIEHLDRAIGSAASPEDKAALYTLISNECVRCGNHELNAHFLRQQVRDLPDDPFSLTSLAFALAQDQRTRTEALEIASQAVALARKQNRQVKYSLTCQARVALEATDYRAFNDALRGLIGDANTPRAEDHGLEFDFLDRVDPNQVDERLISQYRALAKPRQS
jgi:hypothetical protein